ncbi:hypothetical protein SEUCBS140593_009523 [Sporothrix eucalyptigena]|uniref:Uncharacterized protein n=1 Tax=Sporothrix eucalyptigena TaxID=1812306 RepID=A0ABP0CVH1_9PEZI
MTQVKSAIKDNNARHAPTPLIPREIVRRLLQNAYSDMLERWPFLCSLDELLTLLDTQYDTSGTSFVAIAGSALIQVVVALAIRQKMAAGAESHISGISHAYYRNACLLMGDLVLVAPSQHTVQALKAMAAFAGGTPDRHAEAMLLMNAEYIEKLTQGECP